MKLTGDERIVIKIRGSLKSPLIYRIQREFINIFFSTDKTFLQPDVGGNKSLNFGFLWAGEETLGGTFLSFRSFPWDLENEGKLYICLW